VTGNGQATSLKAAETGASPPETSLGGNGADPEGFTAAPDPANPDHAIALEAQAGDVPLKMAPATWWLEHRWRDELKKVSPEADILPNLPQKIATGSGG
jgi:hypothetical protein